MREVQIRKDVGALIDHYCASYKERYGRFPMQCTQADEAALEYCLKRTGEFGVLRDMITAYLRLNGQSKDDSWFKQQGHNIQTFKNKLDYLFGCTAEDNVQRPEYVVGFTASGFPIVSHTPKAEVIGFIPTDLQKWIRLPIEGKCVINRQAWIDRGIDLTAWERLWKELYHGSL